MSLLTWVTQHRLLALAIALVTVFAGMAVGVWFLVLRTPATQVDLGQALRLYRQGQRTGRSRGTDLPASGVYRYLTSGGEQLSIGGISRSFPTATDMIVTEARCATMKWEPLEEHMEGLVECPQSDGAFTIQSALSYEQIAGTQSTGVIRCPSDTYFVPPDPSAGKRWHTTCHSGAQRVVFYGQVIGPSWIDIGGREVPALHTRLTLSFSGSTTGTNPNDYWLSLQSGLILRQRETVDVAQQAGPLGSVRYTEHMSITLRSLTPMR